MTLARVEVARNTSFATANWLEFLVPRETGLEARFFCLLIFWIIRQSPESVYVR